MTVVDPKSQKANFWQTPVVIVNSLPWVPAMVVDLNRFALAPALLLQEPPAPLSPAFSFRRAEGMMLWLAVGDALGNTSEAKNPGERYRQFGEIRDYQFHRHCGDSRGYPSDDSQMAFWTLEHLLLHGMVEPDSLMGMFASRRIFGIGSTVAAAIGAFNQGRPALECGQRSAGNGALMRIAPVLFPTIVTASTQLWTDTVLATAITHNDNMALSANIAFVRMLWALLRVERAPEQDWWWQSFSEDLRLLELEGKRYIPRAPELRRETYTLSEFLDTEVPKALAGGWQIREAGSRWHSGAFLLETVPMVLLILARYFKDPEEAIVRAVNETRDNDTVAAIVGAAVGAYYGTDALPPRWRQRLSGRTREEDDGQMFRLLEQASATWGGA